MKYLTTLILALIVSLGGYGQDEVIEQFNGEYVSMDGRSDTLIMLNGDPWKYLNGRNIIVVIETYTTRSGSIYHIGEDGEIMWWILTDMGIKWEGERGRIEEYRLIRM